MKYSCYFGSDLNSDKDNMIANIMTVSEMKDFIGVDSLGFIDINKIREITNKSGVGVCDACFTGEYPAPVPTEDYVDKFSKKISLEK
jgi:amidophosphoribosyltransferase